MLDITKEDTIELLPLKFWLNSNIVLAMFNESEQKYSLEQIYKRTNQPQQFVMKSRGSWSSNEGLMDARDTRVISRQRQNLMGMHFRSSMVISHNDSINHLEDFK